MKPSHAKTFLAAALKKNRKVLIKGPPGIGKSDIVAQACAEIGHRLMISHPAVSDPTDFKGMPAVTNGGTQAHFLPFGDLQALIEAKEPTQFFLDDLGQAPHSVQAAVMQLILARRVNGHVISKHVGFIGATNGSGDRAGVQSILEPVKSRWDTIIELQPDLDDWCAWAYAHDIPPEVIAFIRFRPSMLNDFQPTRELTNSPSPRTVAAVGRWVGDGITDLEVIEGAAGKAFAAEFIGFLRVYEQLPSIDDILKHPSTAAVPTNPSALYAVIAALVRRFTKQNARACFNYAARFPGKEWEVLLVRDAQRVNPEMKNTPEYTQWALKNVSALA